MINEYMKSTQNIMFPLYVELINNILDTGIMPTEWLIGLIVPFYRNKGGIQDINNYIAKLYGKVVHLNFE